MNKIFLLIAFLFSSTFSISSFTYPWIINLTGDTATVVKWKSNNDTVKAFCDRAADTITNNSARLDTLEDTIAVHSLKIDSLQDTSSLQSARIDTLEDTVAVHSTHLDALDDSTDNRYTKSASDDRYVNEDGDTMSSLLSIQGYTDSTHLQLRGSDGLRATWRIGCPVASTVGFGGNSSHDLSFGYFAGDNSTYTERFGVTATSSLRTNGNKINYDGSASEGLSFDASNNATFTESVTSPIIGDTVVDYASTSSTAGWSSFTTKEIRYQKCGKVVTVWFAISGTSNSVDAGFSLPLTPAAGSDAWFNFTAVDNGGAPVVSVGIMSDTNVPANFAVMQKTPSVSSWTASGTKTVYGQFTYFID